MTFKSDWLDQNKTKQGPLPNKKSDKINTMSGKSESERNC